MWVVLAVAFSGLRIAALNTHLVPSTYVLDAVAVAVFIGGTGDANSPFLALAVAGAWWSGQKATRGRIYAIAFCAAYLVLIAPSSWRAGDVAALFYQPAFVACVGLFADNVRRFTDSRWAFAILNGAGDEGQPASVKVGLSRAVQGGVVPIDVLLTAGQLGLTAMQTELIAYLILGLSNMEIAEAMNVSEAAVRWRLTRLYRALDVRGRKAAAERARELGLDALVAAAPSPAKH